MLKKLFESRPTEAQIAEFDPSPDEQIPELSIESAYSPLVDTVEVFDARGLDGDELLSESETTEVIDTRTVPEVSVVRDLILELHPGLVPELLGGDTVESLISSVASAQAAYDRIVTGFTIPAGGNPPMALDVESIPTFDKIRRGLSTSRS